MTVAAISARKQIHDGNGSPGPFTFNFPILDASFITVTFYSITGVPTVLETPDDYTATAIDLGQSGGEVTLEFDLETGEKLVIEGLTPVSQDVRYANQGAFFPQNHEKSYDKLTMVAQELRDTVARAILVSKTADLTGISLEAPEPAAGEVIGWNSDGTGLTNYTNPGEAYIGALQVEVNVGIMENHVEELSSRAEVNSRLAVRKAAEAVAAAGSISADGITAQAILFNSIGGI